jgi:hypothetical protein
MRRETQEAEDGALVRLLEKRRKKSTQEGLAVIAGDRAPRERRIESRDRVGFDTTVPLFLFPQDQRLQTLGLFRVQA